MVAENYEAVLKGKYPGKAHAKRVVDLIRYLESQMTKMMEDSDEPEPFR
jgi:Xaa-Pro dipeptidase